jgi:tetratricopeptide (TPR) repeat protein/energy-coupling factor transporter ATP-binding protein EcfA2
MARAHVFLSHHPADKPHVEALARKLLDAGLEPWLDKWYLVPGRPWLPAVEEALASARAIVVCIGASGLGQSQDAEVQHALSQAMREPGRLVIPVLLPNAPEKDERPSFLMDRTWVDLRHEPEHALASLRKALLAGKAPGPGARRSGTCPYRGLEAFTEEHARRFFGREEEISELLGRLRKVRLLVLVGASGSGKSSLVMAGLVPAVGTGQLDGSYQWKALKLRPGPRPCHELAVRVTQVLGGGSAMLEELSGRLKDKPSSLSDAVDLSLAGQPGEPRLLLVVDQLEELFTQVSDASEREAFLSALLYAGSVPGGRVHVLLTLRADFMGRCLEHPALAEFVREPHVSYLRAMGRQGLNEAILQPALQEGLTFEDGLVDTLVEEVHGQPGDLPLLQFALEDLWQHRREGQLTWKAYRSLGRLKGAITHRAESLLSRWRPEERAAAQKLFGRLVHLGEGTEDTRRRARRAELEGIHPKLASRILDGLIRERLLTADGEEIEVAHEALIREWGTLRQWLREDRDDLRLRQELGRAAAAWEKGKRADEYVWRGGRLQQVRELRARDRIPLSPAELAFVEASEEAERRLQAEEETRRRKETEAAQREREIQTKLIESQKTSNLRLKAGLIASIVLLLIALVSTWLLRQQSELADQRQKSALKLARSLTTQVQSKLQPIEGTEEVRKELQDQVITLLEELGPEADDAVTLRLRVLSYKKRLELQEDLSLIKKDLESALQTALELAAADPKDHEVRHDLTDLHFALGNIAQKEGQLPQARHHYDEYLILTQRMLEADASDIVAQQNLNFAHMFLSEVSSASGNKKEARAHQEQAILAVQASLKLHPGHFIFEHNLVQNHARLGALLEADELWEEAEGAYKKALENLGPPGSLARIHEPTLYNALTRLSLQKDRPEEALTWYTKASVFAWEQGSKELQSESGRATVAAHYTTLAAFARELGKPEEARGHYEKALALMGPEGLDTKHDRLLEQRAVSYTGLGDLAQEAKKREEARNLYEKALGALEAMATTDSAKTWNLETWNNLYRQLSELAYRLGKAEKEVTYREQQAAILEALLKKNPASVPLRCDQRGVYLRLGERADLAGDLNGAVDLYLKALNLGERLVAEAPGKVLHHRAVLITLRKMASLADRRKTLNAMDLYQKALARSEEALKAFPWDEVLLREQGALHGSLAMLTWERGQRAEARSLYEKAFAAYRRGLKVDPGNRELQFFFAQDNVNLGNALFLEGKTDEAVAAYQQALPILEEQARADADVDEMVLFHLSTLYNRWGLIAEKSGKVEEARLLYEKDLVAMRGLDKQVPNAPSVKSGWWITWSKLGDIAMASGRLAQARAYYEKGLARTKQLATAEPGSLELQRGLGRAYHALGEAQVASGMLKDARASHEKGLERARMLAEKHPESKLLHLDLASSYRGMARVEEASGKWEEALRTYEKALVIRVSLAGGPAHADHPECLMMVAEVELDMAALARRRGEREAANTWLESVEKKLGPVRTKATGLEGNIAALEKRLTKLRQL